MSNVQTAIAEFEAEIDEEINTKLREIGEQGVEYAKANGNYRNRTGHLRNSNKYKVQNKHMKLYNDASYCTDMEARVFDVISGAILYTEDLAKKEFTNAD